MEQKRRSEYWKGVDTALRITEDIHDPPASLPSRGFASVRPHFPPVINASSLIDLLAEKKAAEIRGYDSKG
jgi:hypothetical protein